MKFDSNLILSGFMQPFKRQAVVDLRRQSGEGLKYSEWSHPAY